MLLSNMFQAKPGWWVLDILFLLPLKLGGHSILYDEGYVPSFNTAHGFEMQS